VLFIPDALIGEPVRMLPAYAIHAKFMAKYIRAIKGNEAHAKQFAYCFFTRKETLSRQ
jgi:hypothetical protein